MLSKLSMDLFLCPLLSPTKSETNIYLRFCISLSINKKLNIKVLTYFYLYLLSLSMIDSFSWLIFFFCIFALFLYFSFQEWVFMQISRSLYALLLSDTNLSMAHIHVILALINFLYPMEYQRIHFFSYYFFFSCFFLFQRNFQLRCTTSVFKETSKKFVIFLVLFIVQFNFPQEKFAREKKEKNKN